MYAELDTTRPEQWTALGSNSRGVHTHVDIEVSRGKNNVEKVETRSKYYNE